MLRSLSSNWKPKVIIIGEGHKVSLNEVMGGSLFTCEKMAWLRK